METQLVQVGCKPGPDSNKKETLQSVEFEGELLGKVSNGDTYGVTLKLYQTKKGLVLHRKQWSKWVGESNYYELIETDKEEVQKNSPKLAKKCDFYEPMSLEDALE